VPSYPTPERAVAALGRVARYARWRTAPVGEYVRPAGIDVQGARTLVEAALGGSRSDGPPSDAPLSGPPPSDTVLDATVLDATVLDATVVDDVQCVALLHCYGIDVLPFRRATSPADTVAAARELGFPVAIKAVAKRWQHRADGAGVRLSVVTHQGARQAFTDLARASGRDEVYVQRMGPPGTACAFTVVDDPSFGSLLAFGLSGMASELHGDRAYRVLPLSTVDAADLVRAPRGAPLLSGYRGSTPAKLEALEDIALRLSRLAADLREVRSLVLDPVLAGPEGAAVSGARIVLGSPPTRENAGPRRLG
jgi:acyl-CoA synthetase (NDP forming)